MAKAKTALKSAKEAGSKKNVKVTPKSASKPLPTKVASKPVSKKSMPEKKGVLKSSMKAAAKTISENDSAKNIGKKAPKNLSNKATKENVKSSLTSATHSAKTSVKSTAQSIVKSVVKAVSKTSLKLAEKMGSKEINNFKKIDDSVETQNSVISESKNKSQMDFSSQLKPSTLSAKKSDVVARVSKSKQIKDNESSEGESFEEEDHLGEAEGKSERLKKAEKPEKIDKNDKPSKASKKAMKIDDSVPSNWSEVYEKYKDLSVTPYKMSGTFYEKTAIDHKVLGWGFILSVVNDRLEVLFQSGVKHLISNYKPT